MVRGNNAAAIEQPVGDSMLPEKQESRVLAIAAKRRPLTPRRGANLALAYAEDEFLGIDHGRPGERGLNGLKAALGFARHEQRFGNGIIADSRDPETADDPLATEEARLLAELEQVRKARRERPGA